MRFIDTHSHLYDEAFHQEEDQAIERAVEAGVNPIKAIQCASLNTAEYFRLKNLGAVAPGYKADLLILPDLKTIDPDIVIKDGKIVAQNGQLIGGYEKYEKPSIVCSKISFIISS